MKIGIIVFSKTGNTASVSKRLMESLTAVGHNVNIEQVTANNDDQIDESKVILVSKPDISAYDALLIGSPVRGFSLSAVMSAYIAQAAALQGKQIYCFVTQAFPFPAMGGRRAIEQMKSKCQAKGGKVCGTGIVNWTNPRREKMIAEMVESMKGMF